MTSTRSKIVETPSEYRDRLTRWLDDNLASRASRVLDEAEKREIAQQMYDEGLTALTWPEQYGGRGLSGDFQTVYNEAVAQYDWAMLATTVTIGICGATLSDFGTEEQKLRHLPRMLRGDERWTQLLSEPGAGSDLASVSTRAVRDGDRWIVNGQKVWTSSAVESHYALALVRTDPTAPARKGVSMMIVDLSAPGVEIRPLREMTGRAAFNEVFLNDVALDGDSILGNPGEGWSILLRMLTHERLALSAGTTGRRMDLEAFPRLLELARARGNVNSGEVRGLLSEVFIQQKLLDLLGSRMRTASELGLSMGPVGSIGKVGAAKAARLAAEAGIAIGGNDAQAWAADDEVSTELARTLLHFPSAGIAGGTTEIQKNTIAERLLGLPREPLPQSPTTPPVK